MAELTSKVVEGITYWNIPTDAAGKKAASEVFQTKLRAIYDKELTKAGGKLSKDQISALRNHPDLGVWVINGKPASVGNVNAFLTKKPIGSKKKIVENLSLVEPKSQSLFSRQYFEKLENAPREFTDWIDRLQGASGKGTFWPKGTDLKGFKKHLAQEGYKRTLELNKALEAKLGFPFDVGHMWGAMGPKGDRTIIGPYGVRSEGKFSPQNVAPQPKSPTLAQLLDPKWNVITPNVPGFYDKAGYQIAGAQDLLDVGAGGQGWSSSLADYLMSKSPNINKLGDIDPYHRAYIAFGDPSKGAGKTPQARLAQVEDFMLNQVPKGATQGNFIDYVKTGPRTAAESLSIAKGAATKGQKPFAYIPKESGINLQDVLKVAGKKSRLARLFIPSAASAVIAPFTIADAKARTAKAEATGYWLDKVQAKLAQTEAAADVTGVVPNPVSEVGGLGAGLSNILIDSGRWLAKDRSEEQSQNAEKAMQLQINR